MGTGIYQPTFTFLLLAIFYVYKQMKKVAAARREVIDANKRLKELNDELHLSNAQLKEANHSIAENSYLKEEYIGRYMDQCSVYLERWTITAGRWERLPLPEMWRNSTRTSSLLNS